MKLKPALTYEEQVDRLISVHNLGILNRTKAIEILKKINYYRLSAYGIGLYQSDDPEKYRDGITLKHLYQLYAFDSLLRSFLFHSIEQLEIQLRTQISNCLALQYEAEGYMEARNFSDRKLKDGSSVYHNTINKFKHECFRQRNVPFVKHHHSVYADHFPIWVAVELFSFGNLTALFSIMKIEDQNNVAKNYSTDAKHLKSWLLSLLEVRNICAHYGRIYNMPLKQRPKLYREYKVYKSSNKIFPVLLIIKRMFNGKEQWKLLCEQICQLMIKYQEVVNPSFMDFPNNWHEILSK